MGKEKKDKMREERLKRMKAFQASTGLREDVEENLNQITTELSDNEDDMEEDEKIEEVEPSENPFYSSFKESLVNKEDIDDPLKREMLRIKAQEDEEEGNKLEKEVEHKASKPETSSLPTEQSNEYEKYSGVGILKSIIDSDKEKIQTEIEEEESKRRA